MSNKIFYPEDTIYMMRKVIASNVTIILLRKMKWVKF